MVVARHRLDGREFGGRRLCRSIVACLAGVLVPAFSVFFALSLVILLSLVVVSDAVLPVLGFAVRLGGESDFLSLPGRGGRCGYVSACAAPCSRVNSLEGILPGTPFSSSAAPSPSSSSYSSLSSSPSSSSSSSSSSSNLQVHRSASAS